MELNNLYYRIKNEINILSSKINVPTELIPEINVSNEYASQFIEIDINNIVYLVIKERGNEIERLIPKDLNQLLFFVFKNITFTMAKNFELNNRIQNQDCRIIIFKKQLELINILDDSWVEIVKKEHEYYLNNY